MYSSWVLGFNPNNFNNLAFPKWVTLRKLPFEHHNQAIAMSKTLGEAIGIDTVYETAQDQRLLINFMVNNGWISSIDLDLGREISPLERVQVDYDNLPIKCKASHT